MDYVAPKEDVSKRDMIVVGAFAYQLKPGAVSQFDSQISTLL